MPFHQFFRILTLGIFLTVPGFAADPPPVLTPQEAVEGWLSLYDGHTAFGWTNGTVTAGRLEAVGPIRYLVALPPGRLVLTGTGQVAVSEIAPESDKASDKARVAKALSAEPTTVETTKPFVLDLLGSSTVTLAKYKPVPGKPLFNGKDLSGWTAYTGDPKREKSKFNVTPTGELSIKDGPGDLQTQGTFADFLLQLDCKTNGAALNSGVFFRCLPKQYQAGYEAQIQNAHKEGDRSKPADFGTGAIYRRIAARRVVSDDNTWFTMTVLARGDRIATWVNGYPVVSWQDDRPPNDNARQGRKTTAGHLSLQGHDPTTDLLFRNIRIQPFE